MLYMLQLLVYLRGLLFGVIVGSRLANLSVSSAERRSIHTILVSILLVYELFSELLQFDCCKRFVNSFHIGGVMTR
jgi:hypothetical protein